MIDSDELIHQADDDQQRGFSDKIERVREDELKATADYLGVQMSDGASWQDYRDAFRNYSWRDVTRALEHGTGGEDYANL
jgi:LmbE family N-acetylglucosaminyl deacetylase